MEELKWKIGEYVPVHQRQVCGGICTVICREVNYNKKMEMIRDSKEREHLIVRPPSSKMNLNIYFKQWGGGGNKLQLTSQKGW